MVDINKVGHVVLKVRDLEKSAEGRFGVSPCGYANQRRRRET